MSLPHADTREAPLLEPDRLVAWLYGSETVVQVALEGHRYANLPGPRQFAELLAMAQDSGFDWVLMDGPRQMRRSWLLDPWWSERPELSPKILRDTRAGCLASADLRAALERHSAGS